MLLEKIVRLKRPGPLPLQLGPGLLESQERLPCVLLKALELKTGVALLKGGEISLESSAPLGGKLRPNLHSARRQHDRRLSRRLQMAKIGEHPAPPAGIHHLVTKRTVAVLVDPTGITTTRTGQSIDRLRRVGFYPLGPLQSQPIDNVEIVSAHLAQVRLDLDLHALDTGLPVNTQKACGADDHGVHPSAGPRLQASSQPLFEIATYLGKVLAHLNEQLAIERVDEIEKQSGAKVRVVLGQFGQTRRATSLHRVGRRPVLKFAELSVDMAALELGVVDDGTHYQQRYPHLRIVEDKPDEQFQDETDSATVASTVARMTGPSA